MRVPQRVDYALRALTAIAALPPGTSVAAGDVADRLGLPRRFVEQQVTILGKQGILGSHRGARGGSFMTRTAGEVTVAEVVRALQGSVLDVPAVADSAVSEMWASAAASLEQTLEAVTVADLVERQKTMDMAESPMYHI